MKKILSLMLAIMMLVSSVPAAFALEDGMYICPNGHEYDRHSARETIITVEPTCSSMGYSQAYCPECGELSENGYWDVERFSHTEGEPVRENEIPANCESDGYYEEAIYCTVCNSELSRISYYTPNLGGHTPNDPVIENGYSVVYCSVCGEEISREAVSEPEVSINDYSHGTKVVFETAGTEAYTITVPASLAPGASGNVIAQGTWASNRKLTVTADEDVTLTNSINAADQKVLDVTFPGIELAGSNTAAVSDTKAVSVAGIDNALFGTWSGTFYYDVEMVDRENQVNTPLKFGQKYTGVSTSLVFLEDGTVEFYYNEEAHINETPSQISIATYSNKKISFSNGMFLTVSNDGLSVAKALGEDNSISYIYRDGYDNNLSSPVLNEYGFYFDEFYSYMMSYVFYEDGSAEIYANDDSESVEKIPAGYFTYTENTITDNEGFILNISNDGTMITDPESLSVFTLVLAQ